LPNFSEQFKLDVDASDVAVGGVLHQSSGPISFFSRKLSPSEKNYSTLDKEFLALKESVKKFHPYLFGRKFEIYTDHKPLTSFLRKKMISTRQERWNLFLQNYEFDLHYVKGLNNVAADSLSRIASCASNNSLYEKVCIEQQKCKNILNSLLILNKKGVTVPDNQLSKCVKKCLDKGLRNFHINDGVLMNDNCIVVPFHLEKEVIERIHSCGHFSASATQKAINTRYWFPQMYTKIKELVNACACKLQKSYGHNPQPSHFPYKNIQPFEVVSVDLVSMPLSRQYRYILTMIDMKTRFLCAVPLPNSSADAVSSAFFKRWICQFGPPAVVHSDQGRQFVTDLFDQLKNRFKISSSTSSVYHPKGNSVIERSHRTLKDRLRSMAGLWSDRLEESVLCCNQQSGAFLSVFGRCAVPLCDWPQSSDFLRRKQSSTGPQSGDNVAIRDRKPLTTISPRFKGSIAVQRRLGNSVLLTDGRQINLHDVNLVEKK